MRLLKKIFRVFLVILVLALAYGIWYAWRSFPIISGYGAKNLASGVFLQHRNPADIIREDLGDFPLSLGSFTVNWEDSSVTGKVWGFAKRKAIYRTGVGCTLVNEVPESVVRSQSFDIPPAPTTNRDSIAWPIGDRLVDTLPAHIDREHLNKIVGDVINETHEGVPCYTSGVLVVYDGQIIAEQYGRGFDQHTVMLGWSMSKSFTAAMIGLLAKRGLLNPDAPAPVPEWKGTEKEKITLKDLLQQSSGLDFLEDYTKFSDVTNMLFNKGDMAAYAAARPLAHPPGSVFNYSGGNTNILSRIIRQTVGEKAYPGFPYSDLFYKINAYSFRMEPDASGTYVGSSYSYATLRDFARFGLLYLNNGLWNGEQLLPDDWVTKTRQPAPADTLQHYGYQFWLNGFEKGSPGVRDYPDVPPDMYYCDGYGGQDIYIIPSKKLVVVRTGLHVIDENRMLKEIIASIK